MENEKYNDIDIVDIPETDSAVDDQSDAESSETLMNHHHGRQLKRPWFRGSIFIAVCCHFTTALILAGIVAALRHIKIQDDFGLFLLQSETLALTFRKDSCPAKQAIKYEYSTLDHNLVIENPFKGEPRPEQDKAWDDLLQHQNLVISQDELHAPDAVRLNDGTDRIVFNLDVFHNLHCLNYLRKYIFRSYYSHEYPDSAQNAYLDHVGHCIDMIRQSLMCAADISISTYDWKMDHLKPWPNFRVAHECANWDSIVAWAQRHRAPNLYGNMLMHPKLGAISPQTGPAYPTETGL
ncbi:hypothetical protein HIM_00756 [Hirsutella minnesotensis 3608]|nr:hypothetical protein HIM_00756 [Hirsutella minnesotensis 3608]